MAKKILLVLILIFMFALFLYSSENYLGFNIQGNCELFSFGGFRGAYSELGISPLIGLSHLIKFNEIINIENNFLFGFIYQQTYSSYGYGYGTYFYGFNFITYANLLLKFGNKKVKFIFSPPVALFSFAIGSTTGISNDPEYRNEISNGFGYNFRAGLEVIYLGLDIYLGKEKNIIYTPSYIFCNLLWGMPATILPRVSLGIGTSIKFKIKKSSGNLDDS